MRVIYKYPIALAEVQEILMPDKGDFLSVQAQNGQVCIWSLIDTESPLVKKKIYIAATGQEFKVPTGLGLSYLGTVQLQTLVWHIFMEVK